MSRPPKCIINAFHTSELITESYKSVGSKHLSTCLQKENNMPIKCIFTTWQPCLVGWLNHVLKPIGKFLSILGTLSTSLNKWCI